MPNSPTNIPAAARTFITAATDAAFGAPGGKLNRVGQNWVALLYPGDPASRVYLDDLLGRLARRKAAVNAVRRGAPWYATR